MIVNDPDLREIINNAQPVEIEGRQYIVERSSNSKGSCEGCYFEDKRTCPTQAVTFCTSNGGNVLKLVEPNR